jgi:hypothetical protein
MVYEELVAPPALPKKGFDELRFSNSWSPFILQKVLRSLEEARKMGNASR